MKDIEDRMNEILHRSSCSSSTELGEYYLGMLPAERARQVKQHLKECPHCTAELTQLKSFLQEVGPDLEYSRIEQVRIWIAERLPAFSAPGQMAPAFAMRGDEQAPQVYRAGQAEITLQFEPQAGHPERGSLLGLLSGVAPSGLSADLWQASRRVSSVDLDELGNFVFPDLERGIYQLILSGGELEIHVEALEV